MANQIIPIDVPDDTRSLHAIGDFILSYQPYQNAFLNALVNRIGMTIVTSKMWSNPWAVFKRGMLEMGETIEEIFVNIADVHSFDPVTAEKNVFAREIPDVRAAFHTMNFQKYYKVTISNDQLRQAFLSWQGITDLIARIVDSLYTSMNLDEYLTMKYMLARALVNGDVYTVQTAAVSGSGANPADSITKYREYTNNMTFLKTEYNMAHVRNATPVADQIIIMPNATEAIQGVEVLANAFNINQVDYLSQRIAVDSFDFSAEDTQRLAEIFENDKTYTPLTGTEIAALQAVNAVKLDKEFWMVFDVYQNMTQQYNGEGLYWNYWLHCWKIFSVSPFANAVAFTSQTTEVTSVTVSPDTANVAQGTDIVMTAAVAGEGLFPKTVTWSIKPAGEYELASGTAIDPTSGRLHVAADEATTNKIVVTATSVDGKTGTATITVTASAGA